MREMMCEDILLMCVMQPDFTIDWDCVSPVVLSPALVKRLETQGKMVLLI